MNLINPAITLLLISSTSADENDTTSYRESRRLLGLTKRQTDWIKTHNTKRRQYHTQFGGNFSNIKWSKPLRTQAFNLAKSMAQNECKYQAPPNKDYGITYAKAAGSSKIPTVASIMDIWEESLEEGYPENGAMTQVLWSKSKYVGCADVYSGDEAEYKCYATVCLYAKAGNCNMDEYLPDWQDAVINGPGCGKCPPNVATC